MWFISQVLALSLRRHKFGRVETQVIHASARCGSACAIRVMRWNVGNVATVGLDVSVIGSLPQGHGPQRRVGPGRGDGTGVGGHAGAARLTAARPTTARAINTPRGWCAHRNEECQGGPA